MKKIKYHPTSKYAVRVLTVLIILFFNSLNANPSNCETEVFKIDQKFLSSNFSRCEILDENAIRLYLSPEDKFVNNPSPWFAFRKSAHQEEIYVELFYEKFEHRYHPKVSYDLINWKKIDRDMIKIQNNGKKVTLTFKANNKESFISAQEILSSVWYENWYDNLSYFKNVKISELGRTSEGRPISKILIGNNLKNPYIFLLGRQHPPEVTGAFALKSFIEGILNHNDLTKEFLSNFNIISYPLVNPDGVDLGHWRHNLSEKDLNRDWGFFSQIETSIIYEDIKKILKEHEIVLMIDFHSTFENIFYIQDQLEIAGYNFAQAWLLKNSSDKNNYTFTIKPTKSTNNGVAKNYFYSSYDIPAITFEVGDNTDRRAIINSSENFANSMMRLLLENN